MEHIDVLESIEKYVIDMRREFHANPELSFEEFRTSKRITEELNKMGIENTKCAGTGVIGIIKGKKPGKTVALRADMDALKITEVNDIPYKSQNIGVMHACGHDGHSAMLLGAAKMLNAIKDEISGTIKLIFQPAEEMIAGAKKMIDEGAIDGIDGILGIHLWNNIETGKINVEAGPRMASADPVIIDFYGKGGHGSMPNQTIDPVVVASSFVMNSLSMLSREKSPMDSVAFTIGDLKCGTRFNVIPDNAHLEGTLRCFGEKSRKHCIDAIKRYAESTALMYNAKAKVKMTKGTPATINDDKFSQIAFETGKKIVGTDNMIHLEKTTGSEDMSYYLSEIPGAIAFVGSGYKEKEKTYPHHHPMFDINEDSLKIGTALYVNFALDFLNNEGQQ